MKKLIGIIALLTAVQACKHPQENVKPDQIIINGTADKMYNGQSIILQNNSLNQSDTAKIVNGRFQFKIPFKEATLYHFNSNNKSGTPQTPFNILVAHPGPIAFKANIGNLAGSQVSGAYDNDLYTAYVRSELHARQLVEETLVKKYGQNYIKHFEPDDKLYKSAMAYYGQLAGAITANTFGFVQKNADSYAAMYMLQTKVNELNADTLNLLYNRLSNTYKKTGAATIIANKIRAERATAIGKLAPDFEQADTAGKMIKLSSFRNKFVLIDFWASWCVPCREENPNVLKAYTQFHDKGFRVMGVSLDRKEDKEKWLAAIHHDKLPWTQVSDLQFVKNAAAITYGVTSIPQNFLIGPDGKITAKGLMGDELINTLKKLLPAK
jgi:peroxiredoxin